MTPHGKLTLALVAIAIGTFWGPGMRPPSRYANAAELDSGARASRPLQASHWQDREAEPANVDLDEDASADTATATTTLLRVVRSELRVSVPPLAPDAIDVLWHGQRYWYDHGLWYLQEASGWSAVQPPAGPVVPTLPDSYTTVWYENVPYYYAYDVYYAVVPGGYRVVEPDR